jgi:hypothetical protein
VIATLRHMNFFLRHAGLNLFGMVLFAVTLCVVFPFFLVIVILGTASTGACALGNWRDERRGGHGGARAQERLSFVSRRKMETTQRSEDLEYWRR